MSNPFVVLARGWFYGGGLAITLAHRSGLTVLPYHDTSDKPINLVQQKKPNVAHKSGCNSVLEVMEAHLTINPTTAMFEAYAILYQVCSREEICQSLKGFQGKKHSRILR